MRVPTLLNVEYQLLRQAELNHTFQKVDPVVKYLFLPDNISCVLMLHGTVDNEDNRYVSYITDILIDQELKVGNVNDSEIPIIHKYR